MNRHAFTGLFLAFACLAPTSSKAATWQYQVPFEASKATTERANVFLWMPPQAKTIRGVLVGGRLGIELEIALDPEVRKACAENEIAIVYFSPHVSGVFHYWGDGNTDTNRWLRAFDDLSQRSGHPELRRVPWITMGHSTAGIFCRNVAYWQPDRVAGVIHIKSGNFHQKDHLPPTGSLVGVPLVAINGQFETFGPAAGIQPELGRETQWIYVRKDIEKFREQDANYLMSTWLDLGGDHFHGSPELSKFAALFIRKTAKYRIPAAIPPGDDPVKCLPLKLEDGWLTDPDLYAAKHAPTAFKDYTGDRRKAMWHYDEDTARVNAQHHKNMGKHQCLSNPVGTWLDEGDGWTFQVKANWLDAMPQGYGGSVGGKPVGHSETPFLFRCKINEPVAQVGPDKFQLLRPVAKTVNIAAVHLGDEQFRATNRWGSLAIPAVKGEKQIIDFPTIADLKADSEAVELKGKASSGLPLYFEVDYGPVVIQDGKLAVSELPTNPQFPIECKVTAYQIGRRSGGAILSATPVSQVFKIIKP